VQREPARVRRIADRPLEVGQVDQPGQVAARLEDAQQVVGQPHRPGAGLGPLGDRGLDEPAAPAAAALGGAAAVGLAGQAPGQH
jgi:hypothetical protein